jgi:hypothetical protein
LLGFEIAINWGSVTGVVVDATPVVFCHGSTRAAPPIAVKNKNHKDRTAK